MSAPPSTVTRHRGDDWVITGTLGGTGTLAAATVAAQFRAQPDGPLVATATVTVVDAAARRVMLTVPAAVTAQIRPGVLVYDVQVDEGGVRTTYGGGSRLVVAGDVTR